MLDSRTARTRPLWPSGAAAGEEDRAPAVLMLEALLAMLRRRKLPMVLSATLVPLLACIAITQTTPRYTGMGAVIYDPSAYAARELQSILRADPTTDAVMASQIEILQGLRMAERLTDRFDLDRYPEFNPALLPPSLWRSFANGILRWLGPGAVNPQSQHQVVIRAAQKAIGAKTVKASRVIEISFTATSPSLAADAANALIELYLGDQLALKADAVRHANNWLDAQVGELRREVREAEDRIAAYRAREGLVQGVQAGLDTEQVSRLSADLVQARNDLAEAQSRLDAARGRSGGVGQAVIAPSVVALRSQQDQLSGQIQSLLARLGPNHPTVVGLRGQLAELERAAGAETGRVLAANDAEVRTARGRIAALEQSLNEARAQVARSARSQIPLNVMQRDADAARGLLQTVLERLQQTAQQAAIEIPDARIVSSALPPDQPSSPKTLLLMAAASVFGVCFGLLLVYLLETMDGTFRSGDEIRAVLGLPCFALIPQLRRTALRRVRVEDYATEKPLSPFAEQLRALRAGLWLGPEHPRVVAITAARPSEGKTTIAIALGRSAALSGERVIVLDCDVRQPSFGRLMRADGGLGIVDCLLGHAQLEQVIQKDRICSTPSVG
jgi:polysaccharide biosynthesis transport protein